MKEKKALKLQRKFAKAVLKAKKKISKAQEKAVKKTGAPLSESDRNLPKFLRES